MTIETKAAKQAILDKLESQIKTAEAKLDTLKARAEAAKADAEIKAIAELATRKVQLHQKLHELKNSAEASWEHAKKQFQSLVTEFERDVENIEAKAHAHSH